MAEQIELSKPFPTRDLAAMGGFRRVLANSTVWEHSEFAFWVILKTGGGEVKYHFSTPQTDGSSHGVKLTLPVGQIVRAFCHSTLR